jgi:hypothetical protein
MTVLLCSCGKEDELITFPPGEYISSCYSSGDDSKKTEINIDRDFKSQTVQTFIYPDVTNCSGPRTAESEPMSSEVLIVFSNVDLGNGFSYLTNTVEENGAQQVTYIGFKYENTKLYFSPAVSELGSDPRSTFADFIAEPDFIAEFILTRKDLNRPLSKN